METSTPTGAEEDDLGAFLSAGPYSSGAGEMDRKLGVAGPIQRRGHSIHAAFQRHGQRRAAEMMVQRLGRRGLGA